MSYPGGKNGSGVYQTLINLMPPHDVYIEPFLGGAALMRLKRPARLNIGIDLAEDVVRFWQDAGPTLISEGAAGPAEMARSAARAKSSDVRSRRRRTPELAMPPAYPPAKSGDATRFEFSHCDGIDFLRRYSFTGHELVYADPPYVRSSRTTAEALYTHEMTDAQHVELIAVLKALPCRVLISGYSSPLYAKHLKGWNATAFQTCIRRGIRRAEWVWYNFDRPVELHDYRFLGSDYRERERIKRKKLRWVNRLKTMPALERQALLSAIADTA